jgi:hypothetical protein
MRCLPARALFGIHNGCGTACLPHVPPAAARTTTTTTVDDRPSPLTRPQLNAVIELLDAGADPNAEVGKHGMVRGSHTPTQAVSLMPLYAGVIACETLGIHVKPLLVCPHHAMHT